MKKLFLIFIIALIPFASSISTTMLQSYQPGETMIIEIQGNILQPIERNDIVFKRAHVSIAVDYDVKRILDKYYLYAQVPTNLNNYTLFINDISTTVNGQNQAVNFNQTFQVSGNLTDYSVNPGFVVTNQDFFLVVRSNLDQQTTINVNFPEERAIAINPGINNIQFPIISKSSGVYLITIGKYTVPTQILNSQLSNESQETSISVYPKIFRETLKLNTQKTYRILLTNNGQERVDNIYFNYNQEIFSLDKETIFLESNASANISVSLKKLNNPILEKIFVAIGSEIIENITFEISFTENESQVTNSSNPEYYCSELGGKFCSALEMCSGQLNQALDGSCCVGECKLQEESSRNWILYGLIIIVLIILIIIYFKYKKTSLPRPKNLAINSVLKKPI
ncbi:MAG: hypothetical protein AABX23_00935 [Nanoarchaeota archaeon]